jgi:hypothetical protein
LYSEYFPKFVKLSFLAHIPVIITMLLLIGVFVATEVATAHAHALESRHTHQSENHEHRWLGLIFGGWCRVDRLRSRK